MHTPRRDSMPLITCPDCRREISDSALACPGCGGPTYRPARRSLAYTAVKNFLVAGACFGALYWMFSGAILDTSSEHPGPAEDYSSGWPSGPNVAGFSKDLRENGRSLCTAFITPSGRDSPILMVQKHSDQNLLHLKLYNQNWSYPKDTWGKLSVEFPDGNPLTLNGFRSGRVVDATIPPAATVAFVTKFRETAWIMVAQAGEQEPTWRVDLSGVSESMAKLNKCALEQDSPPPQ